MSLGTALKADTQLAEGCQPSVRVLDHPSMTAQTGIAFEAPASDAFLDTSSHEVLAAAGNVVALVRMQFIGPAVRLAAFSCDRWG